MKYIRSKIHTSLFGLLFWKHSLFCDSCNLVSKLLYMHWNDPIQPNTGEAILIEWIQLVAILPKQNIIKPLLYHIVTFPGNRYQTSMTDIDFRYASLFQANNINQRWYEIVHFCLLHGKSHIFRSWLWIGTIFLLIIQTYLSVNNRL